MSEIEKKISQWKNEGYCIVSGLIEQDLLDKCVDLIHKRWDTIEKCCPDFGSNGEFDFPCGEIIDYLPVNENIINFVRKLLGTNDITLIQSDAWSKAGKSPVARNVDSSNTEDSTKSGDLNTSDQESKTRMSGAYTHQKGKNLSNQDQRMHMDYGNNTFLHPSEDWFNPDTVAAIIYFHDTGITEGGTAVAPRQGKDDQAYQHPFINMPGYGSFPFINNKTAAEEYFNGAHPDVAKLREELYEREVIPNYKIGDVLFYRMDTWHRGTPVKEGHIRSIMSLAWRRTECFWYNTWNPGFTKRMYYGPIEKLFVSLSPSQRATIGVPAPGHSYWTQHSINMLKARYPTIDIQPYLQELERSKNE